MKNCPGIRLQIHYVKNQHFSVDSLHANDIEVKKIHTSNKAVVYVLPQPVRLSERLVSAILSDS